MNSQQNSSGSDSATNDQFCQMCGISSKQTILTKVITPENSTKLVMCESCLSVHRLSLLCVSERKKVKENERFVTELQINKRKEARFRLFVFEELSESERLKLEETDLINSGAEFVGISPITARRYLNKLTSRRGVLTRFDDGEKTFIEFSLKVGDFIE